MWTVNPHIVIERYDDTFFVYNTLTCELFKLPAPAAIAFDCLARSSDPQASFERFSARYRSGDPAAIRKQWDTLLSVLAEKGLAWKDGRPLPPLDRPAAFRGASTTGPVVPATPLARPGQALFVQTYEAQGQIGNVSSNNQEFLQQFCREHEGYLIYVASEEAGFHVQALVEDSPSLGIPPDALLIEKISDYARYHKDGLDYFASTEAGVLWQVDFAARQFRGTGTRASALLEQARIFLEVAVTQAGSASTVACHGAVVCRDGLATLLLGDSGQGKSTLAWALSKASDYRVIADDTFFYSPQSGEVSGYLPHLALPTYGLHQASPELGPPYRYTCGVSRVLVPPDAPQLAVAFPVEAFVLLRRTNQVDSTLVPAQGDSIHMLVPRLMSAPKDFWGPAPSEADVRRRLSALIALSRQAPGHGLYLGHDLKQAGTLVTRLAKAHALSAPAVVVTAP